jgi:hypothetical protein
VFGITVIYVRILFSNHAPKISGEPTWIGSRKNQPKTMELTSQTSSFMWFISLSQFQTENGDLSGKTAYQWGCDAKILD